MAARAFFLDGAPRTFCLCGYLHEQGAAGGEGGQQVVAQFLCGLGKHGGFSLSIGFCLSCKNWQRYKRLNVCSAAFSIRRNIALKMTLSSGSGLFLQVFCRLRGSGFNQREGQSE